MHRHMHWHSSLSALLALPLLTACAGAHWQTAEQLQAQVYASGQHQARLACQSRSTPGEVGDCLRQIKGNSYDSYQKQRDAARKPAGPGTPAAD
jgi:hypothetical protein